MRWRISYDRDPLVLPHGKWDLHAVDRIGARHYVSSFCSRRDAQETLDKIISAARSWCSHE